MVQFLFFLFNWLYYWRYYISVIHAIKIERKEEEKRRITISTPGLSLLTCGWQDVELITRYWPNSTPSLNFATAAVTSVCTSVVNCRWHGCRHCYSHAQFAYWSVFLVRGLICMHMNYVQPNIPWSWSNPPVARTNFRSTGVRITVVKPAVSVVTSQHFSAGQKCSQ